MVIDQFNPRVMMTLKFLQLMNGKIGYEEQQNILLKYRLAYISDTWVNWCEGLGTVLANDEVRDGVSIRGGYTVEQKKMKQWALRITAYADRLLTGLDQIDWPNSIKEQQKKLDRKIFRFKYYI